MSQSGEAVKFTEELISIIAQQRHLATRVIISTQEPTLSPQLLQLCNVTIVHRFLSPAWFETLKSHLAGVRGNGSASSHDTFSTIVNLRVGEALVFSPTSFLDVVQTNSDPFCVRVLQALGTAYIKIGIRKRTTADGGQSMMASRPVKAANDPETQDAKTPPPPPNGDTRHQSSQDGMPPNSNAQKIGPNDTDMSIPPKQVPPQTAVEAPMPTSTSVSSSSDVFATTISAHARRCLVNATILHMKRNPRHIEFNQVRDSAEEELGRASGRFTKFDDSDSTIKREVVSVRDRRLRDLVS